jgi:hypothetical protein
MGSDSEKSVQRRSKVVHAGEGMRLNVQGILFTYKAVGEDTAGRYSLTECIVPPHHVAPEPISGIILITVPTIQYGGYFLLTSLMNKSSGYMENLLRQNFLPRRARPRRRDRDPVSDLPDARGRGSSSSAYALVRSNRSTTVCDSLFGGVLFLGAAADRHSSEWSGLLDLRWSAHSRCCSDNTRHRLAQGSASELALLFH